MRLHVRALLVALAIVACASGARAQDYSAVVVFGDSLSDSGNVAQALQLGLPPGSSFTTNPDPVWAELVAQTFAAPGINSLAGGTNYAIGGACVNPNLPCLVTVPGVGEIRLPGIDEQIALHVGSRPDGEADPDALYALWAGSNDLVDILEAALMPAPGAPPANPEAAIAETVRHYARAIQRLQDAGARHIVVFNLPDPGATPFAQSIPDPRFSATLTALAQGYNEALDAGLGSLDDGIVPIDAFGFFDQVVRDPAKYGFTNVDGTACAPLSEAVNALACGPAGSPSPATYAPGANESFLFADGKHPSGAAHAMLASVVTATLAAPVQVSLAGEAGEAAVAAHRSAVAAERLSDMGLERPAGQWRSYVLVRSGRREVDALPRLGEAEADEQAVTLGFGQRASADVWWGAALSLGRHDDGVSGATLDSDTTVGSLHGTWRMGAIHLSGAVNLGRTEVDIERSITLGPAVSTQRGSTAARQVGVDVSLGWTLDALETVRHGPAIGLSWLDQEVDAYRESGRAPTAMNFSAFERSSLVARAGYRVTGEAELSGLVVRPYAGVAYERELDDDPVSVTAGSNTMAGRFTAEGFKPPRHWISADVGVSASLGGQASAVLGYSGRSGDASRGDHLVSAGLRIAF